MTWSGGIRPSCPQSSFCPSCIITMYWDAGPLLKMENLQVFGESAILLLTLNLRPLNNDYLMIRAGDRETTLDLVHQCVWRHYHRGIREHHEGTAPQSETEESHHISEQLSNHRCFSLRYVMPPCVLSPPAT